MAGNGSAYIRVPAQKKIGIKVPKPDETEIHRTAVEDRDWIALGKGKPELQIRVSYNPEHLWPHATLAALKADKLKGLSIVSKAAVSQWILDAQQRLEFAQRGVHRVDHDGNCSCGLTVEVRTGDADDDDDAPDVAYETLREIVLSTPGHYDHRTRSITNLFVAGRLGPSEEGGFWVRKPGPLIEAHWYCVYCGDLGEAQTEPAKSAAFLPHESHNIHDDNFAARGVSKAKWLAMKERELAFWAQQNGTTGGAK